MASERSTGARRRRRRPALIAAGLMLLLAACQNEIKVQGNIPDQEVVQEIRPGVHGRGDVVQLLGSPSAVSTFQDNIWYYIGQKSEQFAFFKPDVRERQVLVVSFDQAGRVGETKTYTLADSRDIDPVDRETPTEGRDLTLLQQLFGNIGRFSSDAIQN